MLGIPDTLGNLIGKNQVAHLLFELAGEGAIFSKKIFDGIDPKVFLVQKDGVDLFIDFFDSRFRSVIKTGDLFREKKKKEKRKEKKKKKKKLLKKAEIWRRKKKTANLVSGILQLLFDKFKVLFKLTLHFFPFQVLHKADHFLSFFINPSLVEENVKSERKIKKTTRRGKRGKKNKVQPEGQNHTQCNPHSQP